MLHTFVDTNVFLSLYAFTDDNVEELRKILELITEKELKLYFTATVNQEFYRNRDKKLSESISELKRSSLALPIPRFMEHHEEVPMIREALKTLSGHRDSLIEKATREIVDRELAADGLFTAIKDSAGVTKYTDDITAAANLRMVRGNPPGKPDSIGDRVNWEILLKNVPNGQDLHVLSRDKDFASPLGIEIANSYLVEEWKTVKKANLFLYPGIKPFVKKHFPQIKLAKDVGRKLAVVALQESGSWQQTHSAIANLNKFYEDVTNDDAVKLFNALIDNPEVNAISADDDVEEFYQKLLRDFWNVIDNEKYKIVVSHVPDVAPF